MNSSKTVGLKPSTPLGKPPLMSKPIARIGEPFQRTYKI